jgi:hypothetical protein
MASTKLKLEIAHQIPGRIRLKIPSAKGNPELLRQISETFGVIPGIEQITVNATTGSVVMHYDTDRHDEFHSRLAAMPHVGRAPSTEIDQLANRIEEEAEFLASHSKSARAIVDFFKQIDREIKRATDNNIDLKIVLALGIIGFTVLEVGATAATPVWVTLTIFSLNHFIEMHTATGGGRLVSAPVIVRA